MGAVVVGGALVQVSTGPSMEKWSGSWRDALEQDTEPPTLLYMEISGYIVRAEFFSFDLHIIKAKLEGHRFKI